MSPRKLNKGGKRVLSTFLFLLFLSNIGLLMLLKESYDIFWCILLGSIIAFVVTLELELLYSIVEFFTEYKSC